MNDAEQMLQSALEKRAEHRGLKNSELTALSHFERVPRRPVSNNYRALGAITNQIVDRIHTISNPYVGSGSGGGSVIANQLHYSNGAGITVDVPGAAPGIQMKSPNWEMYANNAGFELKDVSTGKTIIMATGDITHDVTLREIDFCDAGVAKKRLMLCSALY